MFIFVEGDLCRTLETVIKSLLHQIHVENVSNHRSEETPVFFRTRKRMESNHFKGKLLATKLLLGHRKWM